ncbi:uncharacterized protein LOC5579510 [Aedes aegypti]|uniref:ML domain-containing protein n=1 Tax=Aedes aegypti TaxID=7159 RepID=A0A1S4G482_AEDAE|nr:uncharacterized protein LOC5579510 [Aedes aegypti]
MRRSLALVALLSAVAFAQDGTLHTHPCTGGLPHPNWVRIEGCTQMPCKLIRGQDVNMWLEFTALSSFDGLTTKVMSTVGNEINVPYPLPSDKSNACNWLVNTRCPVDYNEDVEYHLNFYVSYIYPEVPDLKLEISLIDNYNHVQSCFVVDTSVVSS